MSRWFRNAGSRKVLVGPALLLALAAREGGAAEVSHGVVRFALCRTNIQSSDLFKAGDRWGMLVTIDSKARKELVAAARSFPDHTLEVTMGDTLLHRGSIAVAARSGTFASLRSDLAAAQRDLELFHNNLYEGPCGIVPEPGQ